MKADKVTQMRQLVDMVLQAQLGQLRRASDLRAHTKAQIDGLSQARLEMDAHSGTGDAMAALRYQGWADARRMQLQQVLAKQTADWLDARDQARLAFGKVQGFDQVAAKMAAQSPKPR